MTVRDLQGWQRLLILAPAFVIGIGLIAAVLILLVRAFLDSVRDVEHKRVLWIGGVAARRRRRPAHLPRGGVAEGVAPSGRLRTLDRPMDSAPGRSRRAHREELGALRDELGVSSTLAAVLVRRGYADPAAARHVPRGSAAGPRPVRARRHGRGGRDDPRGRRRRPADRVHGDYDADGICATALAVFLLRELGADPVWHLPSRFEEGYGLAAQTIARLADDGVDLVLTVDCGITAVAEVEEATPARPRGRRHGPSPARPTSSPTARSSRRSRATTRSRGSAAPRVVWKLAEALLGAAHPVPRPPPRRRRARDGRRRRAARRREPRARARAACGASPRRRSPACGR